MSPPGRSGDSTTPSPAGSDRWRQRQHLKPLPPSAPFSGSEPLAHRRAPMNATVRTYRLNISTSEGQPLFTVLISRDRSNHVVPAGKQIPAPPPRIQVSVPALVVGQPGEPRMTEPQKRYLFRLLAQQGFDGKAAEAQLKQA